MSSIAPLVRRLLRAGSRPAGVVLLYHRVADLERDPQCLAVAPVHFAEHLDAIVRYGIPMSLSAMLLQARDGSLPPGSVAVTFDDGYADNLSNAAPMLVNAGVPATMFLTTGPIVDEREFWWDVLERCLLWPGSLPAQLRLPVGEWDLSGAAELSTETSTRHAAWDVTQASCPTPRHRVYLDLCARLKAVDSAVRESTLALLSSLAQVPSAPRPAYRPLTTEEVSALSSMPGITIGAHTVTHPSLSSMHAEEQLSEIVRSRRALEQITDGDVASFAYPFGGASDFSRDTVTAARAAGITSGCSTLSGGVTSGTDPFCVPRVVVRDWTAEEFTGRFAAWTGVTVQ